jgi:hypothetical protein
MTSSEKRKNNARLKTFFFPKPKDQTSLISDPMFCVAQRPFVCKLFSCVEGMPALFLQCLCELVRVLTFASTKEALVPSILNPI